jgi:hypothetical protein
LLPGLLLMLGTLGLAMRLIWEMTALSWEQGPQMIGFSLAHGNGPFLLLFFPPLLLIWLLFAAVYLGWSLWKVRRIDLVSLQAVISAIALFAILGLPQGFWIRLFIDRFAHSPHSGNFLIYAAATGDLSTVKALIGRGVSVGTRDREKKTALHGAAVEGDIEAIAYLIAQGADINAVSLWGNSPLEEAISMNRTEAAKYLEAHGAVRIHGTEEQRQKAAEIIVHEDIERMDRARQQPRLPKDKP